MEYKGYTIVEPDRSDTRSIVQDKRPKANRTIFKVFFYDDKDMQLAKEWIDAHPLPTPGPKYYIYDNWPDEAVNIGKRHDPGGFGVAFYGPDKRERAERYCEMLNEGVIRLV